MRKHWVCDSMVLSMGVHSRLTSQSIIKDNESISFPSLAIMDSNFVNKESVICFDVFGHWRVLSPSTVD